jgi:hypothetical protein
LAAPLALAPALDRSFPFLAALARTVALFEPPGRSSYPRGSCARRSGGLLRRHVRVSDFLFALGCGAQLLPIATDGCGAEGMGKSCAPHSAESLDSSLSRGDICVAGAFTFRDRHAQNKTTTYKRCDFTVQKSTEYLGSSAGLGVSVGVRSCLPGTKTEKETVLLMHYISSVKCVGRCGEWPSLHARHFALPYAFLWTGSG